MYYDMSNDDNQSAVNVNKNNIIKSNVEFNFNPSFEQSSHNLIINNHKHNHNHNDDANLNNSDKINDGFSAQFQFDETDYSNTEYIQDMLKD